MKRKETFCPEKGFSLELKPAGCGHLFSFLVLLLQVGKRGKFIRISGCKSSNMHVVLEPSVSPTPAKLDEQHKVMHYREKTLV